jgi:hypothetical protein
MFIDLLCRTFVFDFVNALS